MLAVGCDNGYVVVYDVVGRKMVGSVWGHSGAVTGVGWVGG